MGHWPIWEGRTDLNLVLRTLTAHASAHVKGAYTALILTTPFDAVGVQLYCGAVGADAQDTSVLLDISVGAAGSEQVLLPNLQFADILGADFTDSFCGAPMFPCSIPAGTRVSARIQASTGSRTLTLEVGLLGANFKGWRSPGAWTAHGADTAASRGTGAVIPAAGGGTWVQLVASTSRPIRVLMLSIGPGAIWNQSVHFTANIGFGAAGVEKILYSADHRWRPSGAKARSSWLGPIPCNIPAGTRLAARSDFGVGTGGDTPYYVVYGGS